jgi:hypothetical protein
MLLIALKGQHILARRNAAGYVFPISIALKGQHILAHRNAVGYDAVGYDSISINHHDPILPFQGVGY